MFNILFNIQYFYFYDINNYISQNLVVKIIGSVCAWNGAICFFIYFTNFDFIFTWSYTLSAINSSITIDNLIILFKLFQFGMLFLITIKKIILTEVLM
jgi:hypothetical protein